MTTEIRKPRSRIGLPWWLHGKESTCSAGEALQLFKPGFDPWVRKMPWGGHGNPLQYSCLENPCKRSIRLDHKTEVHKVAKSQTHRKQLSTAQKGAQLFQL